MIDILLATFNSGRYLAAQLDSLLAQRERDWRLLVRDAGSTDRTTEILAACRARHEREQIIPGAPSPACANFSALLAHSTAPYIMFCDHDDVWFPDKVSKSLACLKELEAASPPGVPALVFTDAIVTNESLGETSPSFFRRAALDPARLEPRQLVFQNVAPGCSMMFNAALRDKATPIPKEAVMHDHWVMLVAAAFGRVACLNEPTFFYRQHGDNVLGAPEVGAGYFLRRLRQGRRALRKRLYENVRQAEAFSDRFGNATPDALQAAATLESLPLPARWHAILRHRLFKNGFFRNLGMLAIV